MGITLARGEPFLRVESVVSGDGADACHIQVGECIESINDVTTFDHAVAIKLIEHFGTLNGVVHLCIVDTSRLWPTALAAR